jgi:UDP-N-acetylglucosamine--N-acetylmuramyl-(pentapeptide) pyrophosphoryl-undecaprenol N-acetylglucosamine transferase
VFSVGGYAAGPVSLAARTLQIPVALMEPNSVAGLANVLIAPFVQRAYTAFELVERRFSPEIVLRSGVPLRPGFEPAPYAPSDPLRILVLGGSQGAKSLNETLPEALAGVRLPLFVTHQCGAAHLEAVTKRYNGLDTTEVQVVPFIDDMGGALARSDLVIGRAGAGAVSEIAAVGRPSLLIPYPYASGDHQRLNAESLEKVGAAVCVPSEQATAARILQEINRLVADKSLLIKMAEAARHFGRPHAAEVVARDFLQLAGIFANARSGPPTGGARARYQGEEMVA